MTTTVGIDLASAGRATAVATITWNGSAATISRVSAGHDDESLVRECKDAGTVGIDCPFGWPEPFIQFVAAHQAGSVPLRNTNEAGWKDTYVRRATDIECALKSDHALDAVVAALTARAAERRCTAEPPAAHRHAAQREGWIALPTCKLDDLALG